MRLFILSAAGSCSAEGKRLFDFDIFYFLIDDNFSEEDIFIKLILNPHLHERVSEHRYQKYFGKVSVWPAEYRNRPPIVPPYF
jgi:hypothetical protein